MKKNDFRGITLVSLIITIVVMLIIAGSTVAFISGNDSVVDRATEAKLSEEQISKKELLEQVLMKYNSGSYIGEEDLREFLYKELEISNEYNNGNNIIKFKDLEGNDSYIINDFQGEAAYLKQKDNIWVIQSFSDLGKIAKLEDGDVLISPKSNDELNINSNNNQYAIIDVNDDLKDISFDIPAGKHVKIKLLSDMTITNEGVQRAAINLNSGSTLDLQVEGKVLVRSTYGENGAISSETQVASAGGFAGIRVPDGATLNLSGNGEIKCWGGNAGNGGTFTGAKDSGGSGGGGAGAGIGGNGGNGGKGGDGPSENGGNGEKCGTVNISGNLTVYAYGGAGGEGGDGFYELTDKGVGKNGGRRRSEDILQQE